MTEYRDLPLAPRRMFLKRLVRGATVAVALLTAGLGVGILGYRYIARLSWIDALLNAAMLLGGEGPVGKMQTVAAKLFASFYALFGGILFLTIAGVLLAPAIHRLVHRFHIEATELARSADAGRKDTDRSGGGLA